jgi:CheY-like chemotaxis protein
MRALRAFSQRHSPGLTGGAMMPRAFKQKLSRTVNQPFRPFLNARRSILAAKKKRFLGFMGRLSFDAVDTLIYDPVSANRTATRAALYSLGFRRTETVPTLENFVARIQKSPPDLALCEAQGATDELCEAIQLLRQGGAGHNPFIVVIVTAWEKNDGLIRRVVSSGADDLLLRPFSTALLGQRIEAHIERRKGFVITAEYVGPDRRKEAGRAPDAELFSPPNSLKMKAKDRMPPEAVTKLLDTELKTACEMLQSEKLRRDSFQACVLWRLLQEQRPSPGATPSDLDRLIGLARSIEQRCRDTEFHPAVEWCESILAAAEGLNMGVDHNASMHLLGHAALSMHLIFHPEKSPAEQISEIDATVALIRARSQAQALAS